MTANGVEPVPDLTRGATSGASPTGLGTQLACEPLRLFTSYSGNITALLWFLSLDISGFQLDADFDGALSGSVCLSVLSLRDYAGVRELAKFGNSEATL